MARDIHLQLEAGSSRRRLLDAVRSRVLVPAAVGRAVAAAKKPAVVQRTASSSALLRPQPPAHFRAHAAAGVSLAADEKKYKSVSLGGAAVSSASAKTGDEKRGSAADVSRGVAPGSAVGSIGEAERKKISEANAARASSAPSAVNAR